MITGETSSNFALLESQWPELYRHASSAEKYVHADPATAAVKLRCFAETLVGILYLDLHLPSNPGDGLFEKLKAEHFESVIDNTIRQKLHALRSHDNKAAHGNEIDPSDAAQLLKEAYLLGRWQYTTFSDEASPDYPAFDCPASTPTVNTNLVETNKRLTKQFEEALQELAQIQAEEFQTQQHAATLASPFDETYLTAFRNASLSASRRMDMQEEETLRLLSLEDAFAEYTLTNGQFELVKRLEDFPTSSSENVFMLRGLDCPVNRTHFQPMIGRPRPGCLDRHAKNTLCRIRRC